MFLCISVFLILLCQCSMPLLFLFLLYRVIITQSTIWLLVEYADVLLPPIALFKSSHLTFDYHPVILNELHLMVLAPVLLIGERLIVHNQFILADYLKLANHFPDRFMKRVFLGYTFWWLASLILSFCFCSFLAVFW